MMERVEAKRKLGQGRWDKVLKQRMVTLSEADNYEDAKFEWVATGEVWADESPSWWKTPGKCLCGHIIVYHFGIENTVNGNRAIVGSDHINTYLIIREIKERTGLAEEFITDAMIQEWIDVRLTEMKANAWMKKNGEHFEKMFNEVKELDLRINVHKKGLYWDSKYEMNRHRTTLRKRSTGQPTDPDYKMASIVWRWNHPKNRKAQMMTRGYPNDRLFTDLIMFHAFVEKHRANVKHEDNLLDARLRSILEAKRLAAHTAEHQKEYGVDQYMQNVGIVLTEEDGRNQWEKNFIKDMRNRIFKSFSNGKYIELKDMFTANQLEVLKKISARKKNNKATERQKEYLNTLGADYDVETLTKTQASALIDAIKANRRQQRSVQTSDPLSSPANSGEVAEAIKQEGENYD